MASIRNLPKSSIQQVKEICLFYVNKCQGEYIDNPTAARYVHHMADEITLQLSGVADEIKRNRTDPEMFQALINEWNAYFPKHLASSSPKSVAYQLQQQEQQIAVLRTQVTALTASHERDMQELLKSMDAQLTAYKSSVLLERNHLKTALEQVIFNYTNQLSEARHLATLSQQDLTTQHAKHIAELQDGYEVDKLALCGRFQATESALRTQLASVHNSGGARVHTLKCKLDLMKDKYTALCKKYKKVVNSIITNKQELQIINTEIEEDIAAVTSDSSLDDLMDLQSLESQHSAHPFQSSQGVEESKESFTRSPPLAPPLGAPLAGHGRRRSSIMRDLTETYSEEKKERLRLEEANLFANAQLKAMTQQAEDSKRQQAASERCIQGLKDELAVLSNERTNHLKRLDELEELVSALQRALAGKIDSNKDTCCGDRSQLNERTLTLCHTPHFLDYPDRHELEHGEQKVSGYYHKF